jgi:ligand-binding sensor domain-containing protein
MVLLGLGFLLSAQPLFALDPSRSVFEYNIQTWNRQNGLPFNRISAIVQTSDGYLWMATQNGLARFDGIDFVHVAIPNRDGWHGMSVNCLQVSPRGGFWFGIEAGNFGYFDGTNRFDALSGDWVAPQVNVHAIQEDADGSIWVASRGGVAGLPGGKTNQLFLNTQLGEIQSLYEDPEHRVWIGTFEKGLYYWQNGKLNQFPDKDLVGANIRAINMDQQGRLWVGTSYGLRCYDRDFKRNDALTLYTEVQVLLADKRGAMWIGTSGGGLIRHFNGETSYLRRTNGLAEDYVSSLCEDHEGSLWVGTRDGLTQISDLKFPTASTPDHPLNEPVHGVCASRNGGIWCATSAGIYNFKDKSVSFLPDSTNSNPYTKRVFESRDGDLYALSGVREVRIFSNNKLVATHPNTDWPTAIGEDSHGVVVSVGAQLYHVNRQQMTPFVFKGSAPEFHWIRNLFACADGSLLVATVNGAYRVRDDHAERWSTAEGLPDLDVNCATQDKEGIIWLGGNAGLTRIRNGKVSVIHLGPIDPFISAIVPDDEGNLWLSCSTGVIQANRHQLSNYADGKSTQLGARLYDGVDALRTIDLTEVETVGCKTADGKIWFPGPLGAVQIDPLHIPFNSLPPPVCIQKVLVDGIQTSAGSAPKVRRGNGELAFQYTALSFIAPQKIRFRYKLQGYDTDWIDAGSQRSALYANLAPGAYSFHVQACNVDGVWSTMAQASL